MDKENPKKKRGFFATLFRFIFKTILFILIVILVLGAALYINYLLTKQNPKDYLSSDFLMYTHVDSIGEIYESLIDLQAAEQFLEPEVYQSIIDFRSSSLARHPLFKQALNFQADIQADKTGGAVIVLDLQYRSIVTRLLPTATSFISLEGVEFSKHTKGKIDIFEYNVNEDLSIFISVEKNLLFISTTMDAIETLYANKDTDNALSSDDQRLNKLKNKVSKVGFAEIYINTEDALEIVLGEDESTLNRLISEFSLEKETVLTFDINNSSLFLNTYTEIDLARSSPLENFLGYRASKLGVLDYLSDNTNIYSAVNFESFYGLIEMLVYLQQEKYGETFEKADGYCQSFLKMSLEEMLEWSGNEAGAFTLSRSADPIFFIESKSIGEFEDFKEKLTDSWIFDEDDSLILDNNQVNRIGLPNWLAAIVGLFIDGFENPYYITMGDYVFFCMAPENLSSLISSNNENKFLEEDDIYREIVAEHSDSQNIFFYFDLSRNIPEFINRNPQLYSLLSLYERGVFSMDLSDEEISIELSAVGTSEDKSRILSGYPKKIDFRPSGEINLVSNPESNLPALVYCDGNGKVIMLDVSGELLRTATVDKSSELIRSNEISDNIILVDDNGVVTIMDNQLSIISPYPVETGIKSPYSEQISSGYIYLFSRSDKELNSLNLNSGELSTLPIEFSKHLMYPPSALGNHLAFAPKSLQGSIYVTDLAGNIYDNWPQEVEGISLTGPQIIQESIGENILFLTQSGSFYKWRNSGDEIEGFPIETEKIYHLPPMQISSNRETMNLLVSSDGEISIFKETGEIVNERALNDYSGKELDIKLFDVAGNGTEEIFLYGTGNNITAINQEMSILPGFPVTGFTNPIFLDINFDGIMDMLTISIDGDLYCYSIVE